MPAKQLSLLAETPERASLSEWATTYLRQLQMPDYLRDDPRPLSALSDGELFAIHGFTSPTAVANELVAEAAERGREGDHL